MIYKGLCTLVRIVGAFFCCVVFACSGFVPKKKNRWVFGAWFGNRISDNPWSLFLYVKEKCPQIETIWISNDRCDGIKKICRKNSLKSLFYIITSEVAVVNQGYVDLNFFNLTKKCYVVQLWHGIPWKKIGYDSVSFSGNVVGRILFSLMKYRTNYNLFIAASEMNFELYQKSFQTSATRILKVGQPRNEVLFNSHFCSEAKKILQQECNVSSNTKIVAYMPTFRDNNTNVESFAKPLFLKNINQLALLYEFVIIEKSHYVNAGNVDAEELESVFVRPNIDTQLLLAGADILITDYSSCFFDFLICDRPIIHYVYDYDYYKNQDRGLYYDINDVAAGSIAYDFNQLLHVLELNLQNPSMEFEKRQLRREKFLPYESKENSRIIVERILKDLGR